jgi:dCTP deaminase
VILTGPKIEEEHGRGWIKIDPFSQHQVTTNSYDLRLGETYLEYEDGVLDTRARLNYTERRIPQSGLLLEARKFILGETEEMVGSDHYVPIIHGKSSTARTGLFVHVTADLIDIGYYGRSTLQLYATLPVRLFPRMLIAQVSFWKPMGEIRRYEGKYQGSDGPRASLTYLDHAASPESD